MKELCDFLGVELNEVFMLSNKLGQYRVTSDRLEYRDNDKSSWGESIASVNGFFSYKIIHIPFIPSHEETYYTYIRNSDDIYIKNSNDTWVIHETVWTGAVSDYARLKSGIVFRSKKEALSKLSECYKDLTGDDYRDE